MNGHGQPSKSISPSSKGSIPAMHLINVVLPAPLSPTSAVTSPGPTSRSTSRRTWTAPKLLLIPRGTAAGPAAVPRRPGYPLTPFSSQAFFRAAVVQILSAVVKPSATTSLTFSLEDRLRLEQHRLDLLTGLGVLHRARGLRVGAGGVALGQRDRERGGRVGLLLDRLVDRHALSAEQHALQALVGGVLAGGRDVRRSRPRASSTAATAPPRPSLAAATPTKSPLAFVNICSKIVPAFVLSQSGTD